MQVDADEMTTAKRPCKPRAGRRSLMRPSVQRTSSQAWRPIWVALSTSPRQSVRWVQHAAVLGAVIEHQEACWLAGEEVNETGLLAAVNCQRRLLETVGLERRARDVSSIEDAIKAHRRNATDVETA